jgi:hypothetical protein
MAAEPKPSSAARYAAESAPAAAFWSTAGDTGGSCRTRFQPTGPTGQGDTLENAVTGEPHEAQVVTTSRSGRAEPPRWSTWREIPAVVLHRPHLRQTIRIALVVGTVLFTINQLDVVVRGAATPVVWLKVGLTYLVPFCVSNLGILIASRRQT